MSFRLDFGNDQLMLIIIITICDTMIHHDIAQ